MNRLHWSKYYGSAKSISYEASYCCHNSYKVINEVKNNFKIVETEQKQLKDLLD